MRFGHACERLKGIFFIPQIFRQYSSEGCLRFLRQNVVRAMTEARELCPRMPERVADKLKTGKGKEIIAGCIQDTLLRLYPDAACALEYDPGDENSAFRLLVMARLSAQCTDKRVNEVALRLFKEFPTPHSMAEAPLSRLEELVYPCGVYRVKAKNIKDMSAIICKEYSGSVPDDENALLALPGVGHKIANLMLGDVFGKPAIVADTHCIRISGRLGLCSSSNPDKVTKELSELIDYPDRSAFCHAVVLFGREYCTARSPQCGICPVADALCSLSASI